MSKPALLIWNRLEPNPRSKDIDKALRAEIRDPLWMLSRQWQFGEFQGEDAGFASNVRLKYKKSDVQQFHTLDGVIHSFNGEEHPLDEIIERTECEPDIFIKIEIGRHWLRILKKHLPSEDQTTIIEAFMNSDLLHFQLPPQSDKNQKYEQADVLSNEPYLNTLTTFVNGNLIDGGILIDIIADDQRGLSEHILGNTEERIDELGDKLLEWANRTYCIKTAKSEAWHSSHMEHQFGVEIPIAEKLSKKLEAKEFFGDTLDWYQFDYAKNENIENDSTVNGIVEKEEILIPSPVRYTGMPHTRWWKMEDNTVNFGNIKASSTNPSALIFSQFTLLYGNDWIMMPLSLDLGALYQIQNMVVTDNFGIRTQIKHVHEVAPDENWSFFQMHDKNRGLANQNDSCLFLPPATENVQKSSIQEQVNFIRDEMANMVWGIEDIIPDLLGNGISGAERATALSGFLAAIEDPSSEEDYENQAKLKYVIGSTVPENWIPFIPVHIKDDNVLSRQIQLQRASMPRILQGFNPERIRPKTTLLQEGLMDGPKQPFFIYEEEVPRSGAIVKAFWKRVRWFNGKTVVWYARQKTNGRGEGVSLMKFDQLKEK